MPDNVENKEQYNISNFNNLNFQAIQRIEN